MRGRQGQRAGVPTELGRVLQGKLCIQPHLPSPEHPGLAQVGRAITEQDMGRSRRGGLAGPHPKILAPEDLPAWGGPITLQLRIDLGGSEHREPPAPDHPAQAPGSDLPLDATHRAVARQGLPSSASTCAP